MTDGILTVVYVYWWWLTVSCVDLRWLTVTCSDWRWLTVTDSGWQWLTVTDSGRQWLTMAYSDCQWMTVTDCEWRWLMVTVGDWWLLTVTYRHWWLVSVTDDDLPWSTREWRSDQKFIVRTREGQLRAVKLQGGHWGSEDYQLPFFPPYYRLIIDFLILCILSTWLFQCLHYAHICTHCCYLMRERWCHNFAMAELRYFICFLGEILFNICNWKLVLSIGADPVVTWTNISLL